LNEGAGIFTRHTRNQSVKLNRDGRVVVAELRRPARRLETELFDDYEAKAKMPQSSWIVNAPL